MTDFFFYYYKETLCFMKRSSQVLPELLSIFNILQDTSTSDESPRQQKGFWEKQEVRSVSSVPGCEHCERDFLSASVSRLVGSGQVQDILPARKRLSSHSK